MSILGQDERGEPFIELCRWHGKNSVSFYKWPSKFGGVDALLIFANECAAKKLRLLG